MTLKSDAKFKEKMTCDFNHDMRNSVNFYPTTQKYKIFFSMSSFVLQKYRGVIFHDGEQ